MNASATAIRPILVAREVQEQVLTGIRPHVGRIASKYGYSPSAVRAGKVQRTVAYKREMASFAERLQHLLTKTIARLEETIDTADYNTVTLAILRLTKVILLIQKRVPVNSENPLEHLSNAELQEIIDRGRSQRPA